MRHHALPRNLPQAHQQRPDLFFRFRSSDGSTLFLHHPRGSDLHIIHQESGHNHQSDEAKEPKAAELKIMRRITKMMPTSGGTNQSRVLYRLAAMSRVDWPQIEADYSC